LEPTQRPLTTLMKRISSNVVVKLKNGVEYRGRMIKCDSYMNIILEGASEFFNSNCVANYGDVFIRGNNILYIQVDVDKLL
jgi:small nuclear ribonucleoprotein (snRNP)-like protein